MEARQGRHHPIATAAGKLIGALVFSTVLAVGSALAGAPEFVRGRILVEPKAGVSPTDFTNVLKQHGGKSLGRISALSVHVVSVPLNAEDAVAQALSKNPKVKFAEKDAVRAHAATPNDPQFSAEWHLTKIQAPASWDTSLGNGVVVAVLDTGVDGTHPDLVNKMVAGWNIYDNNSTTSDVYGHGTKVAGVIGAQSNNGVGVASVAWSAAIMPVRISGLDGSASLSRMASGLTWAADHGAKVANISYFCTDSATVQSAAQYFRSKGGVVVSSAGNTGVFNATADSSVIITVGATTSSDAIASFSTFGAFVDVSAPGASVLTTTKGGGYGTVSGTSFSSPCTAGVVALMMAANPALAPTQVEALLLDNADELGTVGWDQYFGHGRVNAARSVAAAVATQVQDTQAPSVSITSPAGSATVKGAVSVDVAATDNADVDRVDLYVNGAFVGSDDLEPYQFSVDTTKLAEGKATLIAYAVDAAGNKGTSLTVAVTVDNIPDPVDTMPPTVKITSPANGATVKGSVTIKVSAGDNVGLSLVQVYVDSALSCVNNTTTVSCSWNTKSATAGVHTITATGQDAAGNKTTVSTQVKK